MALRDSDVFPRANFNPEEGTFEDADHAEVNEEDNGENDENDNDDNTLLTGSDHHDWWSEASGSCGDLGTFIPLFVALSQGRAIHANTALFWTGVAHTATGLTFGRPLPVQPMKAIAALAIASASIDDNDSGTNESTFLAIHVTLAGMWMAFFLFVLGLTNGVAFVSDRLVPLAVVSGLQMGVGITLIQQGCGWWTTSENDEDNHWWNGWFLTLLCFVGAFWGLRSPHAPRPVGVILFGMGISLALLHIHSFTVAFPPWEPCWRPELPHLSQATWHDVFSIGLIQGAIPQLPLTTLNSIISVCSMMNTLFGDPIETPAPRGRRYARATPRRLCYSVAVINMCLIPLGGMPVCHGAGGLAGQFRFGARTGWSVVGLGLAKMVAAVLLGTWLVPLVDAIPRSTILSVLVLLAGVELGQTGLALLLKQQQKQLLADPSQIIATSDDDDELNETPEGPPATRRLVHRNNRTVTKKSSHSDLTSALVTTGVILGTHKTHYGVVAGILVYAIHEPSFFRWRRDRDRGADYHVVSIQSSTISNR